MADATSQGLDKAHAPGPARPHAFIMKVGCEHRVLSPIVVDGHDREFRIKNVGDRPAFVMLPPSIVGRVVGPHEVAPGMTATIPLTAGAGSYTYAVVVSTERGLVTAHGNSDPVIIIDPSWQ